MVVHLYVVRHRAIIVHPETRTSVARSLHLTCSFLHVNSSTRLPDAEEGPRGWTLSGCQPLRYRSSRLSREPCTSGSGDHSTAAVRVCHGRGRAVHCHVPDSSLPVDRSQPCQGPVESELPGGTRRRDVRPDGAFSSSSPRRWARGCVGGANGGADGLEGKGGGVPVHGSRGRALLGRDDGRQTGRHRKNVYQTLLQAAKSLGRDDYLGSKGKFVVVSLDRGALPDNLVRGLIRLTGTACMCGLHVWRQKLGRQFLLCHGSSHPAV